MCAAMMHQMGPPGGGIERVAVERILDTVLCGKKHDWRRPR